jgi:hypothetical protein
MQEGGPKKRRGRGKQGHRSEGQGEGEDLVEGASVVGQLLRVTAKFLCESRGTGYGERVATDDRQTRIWDRAGLWKHERKGQRSQMNKPRTLAPDIHKPHHLEQLKAMGSRSLNRHRQKPGQFHESTLL